MLSLQGPVELGDSAPSCQRTMMETENVLTSPTSQNFTESQSHLTNTSENNVSFRFLQNATMSYCVGVNILI